MLKALIPLSALLLFTACSQDTSSTASESDASLPNDVSTETEQQDAQSTDNQLADILAAQPDKVQARYQYRHPQETLEFFGIEPGMTVVEALPGGGWYSKILLPYLGSEGKLIGADYSLEMFPLFSFFNEERLEAKKTWVADWTEKAEGWSDENGADVGAFVFGTMPEDFEGTADAVLFVRALHNLARFESNGGFLTTALENTYRTLKPGGIVGVVQHEARSETSDDWANGSNGYLKKEALIAIMEKAGFEYLESTNINANPNDQPTEDEIVWRLPPNFATSGESEDVKATMIAIGESNRMTLKFRKPE